jgi:hypothetical protein
MSKATTKQNPLPTPPVRPGPSLVRPALLAQPELLVWPIPPLRPALPAPPVRPGPLPEIPGVEYIPRREPKSTRIVGPFFLDQVDRIITRAQMVRLRHKLGTLFIAPDNERQISFSIYKRRAA